MDTPDDASNLLSEADAILSGALLEDDTDFMGLSNDDTLEDDELNELLKMADTVSAEETPTILEAKAKPAAAKVVPSQNTFAQSKPQNLPINNTVEKLVADDSKLSTFVPSTSTTGGPPKKEEGTLHPSTNGPSFPHINPRDVSSNTVKVQPKPEPVRQEEVESTDPFASSTGGLPQESDPFNQMTSSTVAGEAPKMPSIAQTAPPNGDPFVFSGQSAEQPLEKLYEEKNAKPVDRVDSAIGLPAEQETNTTSHASADPMIAESTVDQNYVSPKPKQLGKIADQKLLSSPEVADDESGIRQRGNTVDTTDDPFAQGPSQDTGLDPFGGPYESKEEPELKPIPQKQPPPTISNNVFVSSIANDTRVNSTSREPTNTQKFMKIQKQPESEDLPPAHNSIDPFAPRGGETTWPASNDPFSAAPPTVTPVEPSNYGSNEIEEHSDPFAASGGSNHVENSYTDPFGPPPVENLPSTSEVKSLAPKPERQFDQQDKGQITNVQEQPGGIVESNADPFAPVEGQEALDPFAPDPNIQASARNVNEGFNDEIKISTVDSKLGSYIQNEVSQGSPELKQVLQHPKESATRQEIENVTPSEVDTDPFASTSEQAGDPFASNISSSEPLQQIDQVFDSQNKGNKDDYEEKVETENIIVQSTLSQEKEPDLKQDETQITQAEYSAQNEANTEADNPFAPKPSDKQSYDIFGSGPPRQDETQVIDNDPFSYTPSAEDQVAHGDDPFAVNRNGIQPAPIKGDLPSKREEKASSKMHALDSGNENETFPPKPSGVHNTNGTLEKEVNNALLSPSEPTESKDQQGNAIETSANDPFAGYENTGGDPFGPPPTNEGQSSRQISSPSENPNVGIPEVTANLAPSRMTPPASFPPPSEVSHQPNAHQGTVSPLMAPTGPPAGRDPHSREASMLTVPSTRRQSPFTQHTARSAASIVASSASPPPRRFQRSNINGGDPFAQPGATRSWSAASMPSTVSMRSRPTPFRSNLSSQSHSLLHQRKMSPRTTRMSPTDASMRSPSPAEAVQSGNLLNSQMNLVEKDDNTNLDDLVAPRLSKSRNDHKSPADLLFPQPKLRQNLQDVSSGSAKPNSQSQQPRPSNVIAKPMMTNRVQPSLRGLPRSRMGFKPVKRDSLHPRGKSVEKLQANMKPQVPNQAPPFRSRVPSQTHSMNSISGNYRNQPQPTHGSSPNFMTGTSSMNAGVNTRSDRQWEPRPACAIATFGIGGRIVTMFPRPVRNIHALAKSNSLVPFSNGPVNVETINEHISSQNLTPILSEPLTAKSDKKKVLESVKAGVRQCTNPNRRRLWELTAALLRADGVITPPPSTSEDSKKSATPGALPDILQMLTQQSHAHPSILKDTTSVAPSGQDAEQLISQMQDLLLQGRRQEACGLAMEKNCWVHALVLAASISPAAYNKVLARYVLRKMNPGVPLQSLYLLLSKQPSQIFQAQNTAGSAGALPQGNTLMTEWRSNLAMMLANRTNGDQKVITMLGDRLWKHQQHPLCAHLCYLLANIPLQPYSSRSRLCVLGSDHIRCPRTYAKSPECVQLTEIYMFVMRVRDPKFIAPPSFQTVKLAYASLLLDMGHMKLASQYLEGLAHHGKANPKSMTGLTAQLAHNLSLRVKVALGGSVGGGFSVVKGLKSVFDVGLGFIMGGGSTPKSTAKENSGLKPISKPAAVHSSVSHRHPQTRPHGQLPLRQPANSGLQRKPLSNRPLAGGPFQQTQPRKVPPRNFVGRSVAPPKVTPRPSIPPRNAPSRDMAARNIATKGRMAANTNQQLPSTVPKRVIPSRQPIHRSFNKNSPQINGKVHNSVQKSAPMRTASNTMSSIHSLTSTTTTKGVSHMSAPSTVVPPMGASPVGAPPISAPATNDLPLNSLPMNSPPMNSPPMNSPPVRSPPMNPPPENTFAMGAASIANPSMGNPMGNPPMGNHPMGNHPMGNPSLGNPLLGNPSQGNPPMVNSSMRSPSVAASSMGTPSMGTASMSAPQVGVSSSGGPSVQPPSSVDPAQNTVQGSGQDNKNNENNESLVGSMLTYLGVKKKVRQVELPNEKEIQYDEATGRWLIEGQVAEKEEEQPPPPKRSELPAPPPSNLAKNLPPKPSFGSSPGVQSRYASVPGFAPAGRPGGRSSMRAPLRVNPPGRNTSQLLRGGPSAATQDGPKARGFPNMRGPTRINPPKRRPGLGQPKPRKASSRTTPSVGLANFPSKDQKAPAQKSNGVEANAKLPPSAKTRMMGMRRSQPKPLPGAQANRNVFMRPKRIPLGSRGAGGRPTSQFGRPKPPF